MKFRHCDKAQILEQIGEHSAACRSKAYQRQGVSDAAKRVLREASATSGRSGFTARSAKLTLQDESLKRAWKTADDDDDNDGDTVLTPTRVPTERQLKNFFAYGGKSSEQLVIRNFVIFLISLTTAYCH